MKKIRLMNKIASVGTDVFDRSRYEVSDEVTNEDAIMVRSASLHDVEFADTVSALYFPFSSPDLPPDRLLLFSYSFSQFQIRYGIQIISMTYSFNIFVICCYSNHGCIIGTKNWRRMIKFNSIFFARSFHGLS